MKALKYIFILFICVLAFSVSGHTAFAGSCSSVAGTSWNTGASWSAGCTGAGGIPGTGDDVTIASGHPITIDTDIPTLNTLTMNDLLSTGANRSITTTGNLTINSGGTLTANASTITVGGWFYNALGTFNQGTSTVVITLNGSTTVINGTNNFYNLSFAPALTGSGQFRIVSPATVSNNFTIAPSGTSVTLTVSLESSLNVGGTLFIGGSGSAVSVFNTHGNPIVTSLLSIGSAGTLTANNSGITITGTSGTLFSAAGTFTAGTSAVSFTGNGTATLNSGSPTFFTVVSSGTGTKSVDGGGISFASGGSLLVQGGTFNSNSLINSSSGASLSVTNATILVPTSMGVEYPFGTINLGTGSTADYNEAGAQTIESSINYYNLNISGSFTKKPNGTLNVSNTLTINSGTFDTNFNIDQTVNVGYIVENGGTAQLNTSIVNFSGTSGTLYTWNAGGIGATSYTFNVTGNGSAIINSISMAICNLNITGTGTKSVGGALFLRDNCALSVTNGTFNPNGSTVTALGAGTISVTNATLNVDAATFTTNYVSFSTVTLGVGSTVNYTAFGAQTIYSGVTYNNLTISGGGGFSKTLSGTTTVTGTLTILSNTFDTGSNFTLNVGNVLINGGAFSAHSSIVNLTGTSGTLFAYTSGSSVGTSAIINVTGNGSVVVTSGGTPGFYSLTSSGTGTKTLGGDIAVSNGLTITNGIFEPGSHTINGSGTATLSVTNAQLNVGASTFAGNFPSFSTITFGTGSTVNYNSSGTQTVYNGSPYYNLTLSNGSREVDFLTTGTTIVTGAFNANGSFGNLISLFSPTTPTRWTFTPLGTASVSYVNVRDGACGASSIYIYPTNMTDSGNNDKCWDPPVATVGRSSGGYLAVIRTQPQTLKPIINFTFTRNLKLGMKGEDIKRLQQYLNNNGFTVSNTGAGSLGQETTKFGTATRTALIKFQKAKSITPAVGYFGPVTRGVVNG